MAAEHLIRIGARIRKRREEMGLTQRELADQLPGKADGNQVSKWERGQHRVSDDTLEHIGAALEVDPSYFLAPEPKTGTPDLMGDIRGAEDRRQLDRIEKKLDKLLEHLVTSPGADEDLGDEGDARDIHLSPDDEDGEPRPAGGRE